MKLKEISIKVFGEDANYSTTLEPEDAIKTFKEAIEWLETIKEDFEEEEVVPF